jgi:hypothetical protein
MGGCPGTSSGAIDTSDLRNWPQQTEGRGTPPASFDSQIIRSSTPHVQACSRVRFKSHRFTGKLDTESHRLYDDWVSVQQWIVLWSSGLGGLNEYW